MLQVQTLPDATQPVFKIHPFSKVAVILEPIMQFVMSFVFKNILHICNMVKFYDWKHNFQSFWLGGAVKLWEEKGDSLT